MLKLLAFGIALSVAKGDLEAVTYHNKKELSRVEDYINVNREKYAKKVKNYDTRLEHLKDSFWSRMELINLQLGMAIEDRDRNEERLNSMAVLSDQHNYCVTYYRSQIPTVTWTEANAADCIASANKSFSIAFSEALKVRDNLANYYTKRFETYIDKCKKDFQSFPASHVSHCVSKTVSNINFDINDNRRLFDFQMNIADCTAKAHINRALECSYAIRRHLNYLIIEADLLIEKCLNVDDMCEPCDPVCPDKFELYVDYRNRTILNPLYGRKDHEDCLLLTAV